MNGSNYIPGNIGRVIDESSANLTNGSTYTTTSWIDVSAQASVAVRVHSSHNGTYSVLFSADGSTTHSTVGPYVYDTAKIFTPKFLARGAKYCKVTFTNNSGANQTDFHIQLLSSPSDQTIKIGLNRTIPKDVDALPVRSLPSWFDAVSGKYEGVEVVKKFGRNSAVGTSFVPVCMGGVYQAPQSGSATTLRIKSGGDANDTAAGSGAREITLIGLDENFEAVTEAVATAGASASSATAATFTRLDRAYVSASGTYATSAAGSHADTITIENGAGGTDWAIIDATDFPLSQSEIGADSIETGKTAFVFLDKITIESGKTVDMVFFRRENINETAAPYSAMRAVITLTGLEGGSTTLSGEKFAFGPFVGPCDIGWLAKVSAGTGSVAASFEVFKADS